MNPNLLEPTARRREEIRRLLRLSPTEMLEQAGRHVRVCDSLDELHLALAREMADELMAHNSAGRRTRWILPVGPVGQYAHFVAEVAARGLSLTGVEAFFMDEYADETGRTLPADHPLSFRRVAREELLAKLPELAQRAVFPTEENIDGLAAQIATGGIDTCYGGIGIHGHLAFNEPEPGVSALGPRLVRLNDFTVTINAIRAGVGGNLEGFPRQAYTLGLRQILEARRVVLACRNGLPCDWANTVLRLALLGEPGDDYPVTHLRGRNFLIYTDRETLASPAFVI